MTIQETVTDTPVSVIRVLFGEDGASRRLVERDKAVQNAVRRNSLDLALNRIEELVSYLGLCQEMLEKLPPQTIDRAYDAVAVQGRWNISRKNIPRTPATIHHSRHPASTR